MRLSMVSTWRARAGAGIPNRWQKADPRYEHVAIGKTDIGKISCSGKSSWCLYGKWQNFCKFLKRKGLNMTFCGHGKNSGFS